jgi:hypothetical protein
MGLFLLILLILFMAGGLPRFSYHSYGYGPSGLAGVLAIVLLVLLLTPRRGCSTVALGDAQRWGEGLDMLLHSCPDDRLRLCAAHTAAPSAICERNASRHRCPVAFAPGYRAPLHLGRPRAT